MSTVTWSFPTKIVFGIGARESLPDEARRLRMKRPLLVTDWGVVDAGLAAPLEKALKDAGLDVASFADVDSNPTEANVDRGAEVYKAHGADGLIALGGGSPLDAAKLIAVRAVSDRSFEQLDDAKGGDRYIDHTVPPIISLPTTAGTGSEVGRSGVLTVASTGRKTVVFSPHLMARVALLDPELTRSLPAHVTAATGIDALTHCIEAYLSKGDHPMADAIALGGIDLVAKHLKTAVRTPGDLEARGAMMKAAMMGAVAFQKGLGACHSLAHPLGSEHGLHHGLANALCLPAVLEFNTEVVADKVLHVGLLLGAEANLASAVGVVRTLRAELGLATALSQVGIQAQHLERLSELAIEDACHQLNPRSCTRQDMLALYRASL
jgi:alcohol dehydrogenase class IV